MTSRPDPPQPAARYQIGDLTVDIPRARVTRQGAELPLPKLSFDLLIALIRTAPAIVSVEQLLEMVWPGLVVNIETVSQRVKLLRTALGDDPRAPRYISVVRGRGYRLVAAVAPLDGETAQPGAPIVALAAAPTVLPAVSRAWRVGQGASIAIACIGAFLFALLWWKWPGPDADNGPAPPVTAAVERSIAVLPFQNLSAAPGDNVLALGVAEAVLHQLAKLRDIAVIARTSSFALSDGKLDARVIGPRLGARYILEGSIQRADLSLRVTAQLVDAASGAHVWSLQFDRNTRDIFAMQDEIAIKVAQALELSLDASATDRLSGQGTTNFDAYFEYLQARDLLADSRVADLGIAHEHLSRAIGLDANFAAAYVDLAGTEIRQAEFDPSGDRSAQFEAAAQRARKLLEKAIRLNPQDGRAYLQRAYLQAFSDLAAAEADYRHGLALAPNDASGYEGLAAVLYQDPRRQDESLTALDRARRLDPLEPRYDVTKAVFLFYGRSDAANANAILQRVVEQHPQYAPALGRFGELKTQSGDTAEGIRYFELSLKLDPSAEWLRRGLVSAYLDLADLAAAAAVAGETQKAVPARQLALHLYRKEWRRAGETAYAALQSETLLANDELLVVSALRHYARKTGEVEDALATLEQLGDLRWAADGEPVIGSTLNLKSAVAGAGDLLLLDGQTDRGRLLLRRALTAMAEQASEFKRGTLWTQLARAQSLALLSDADGAIAALEESARVSFLMPKGWLHLTLDPAFDGLRNRPAFRRLVADWENRTAAERRKLDEMRRSGLVPRR